MTNPDIGIPDPPPAAQPTRYAVYNEDGSFAVLLQCPYDWVAEQCVGPGQELVKDVENAHATRLVNGKVVEYRGEPPDADHIWDSARGAWVLSEAAIQRVHAQIQIDEQEKLSLRAIREWILTHDEKAFTRLLDIDEAIQKHRW
jgi:hypothetical protein